MIHSKETVLKTVSELFDLVKEKQSKVDELQKRVDKAIRLLVEAELYQSEPNIDLAVQALKGGDQNTEKQPNKHAEKIATKGVKGGDQ